MSIKKVLMLGASIALLAAGCSKANNNTQTLPPAATEEVVKANIAITPDPQQGWVRFYPGEYLKLNLLFPLTWFGDEGQTDTHFVLRSRKGADGSKVDDVIMDFTIGPMTTKTLSDQVTSGMKGAKDSSPVMSAKTDEGVPYAFATYIDTSGKPVLGVAMQYQGTEYVHLTVTGNVTYPYVGRMIQSIALNGQQ